MLFQSNFNFNGFPAVSQGKNQLVDLFINEFRCRMTRLNVLPMAFILQRLKLGVDLNENWLVTSENIRQLLAQVELKRLLFPPKFRVGSRFAWKLTFSQQKCLTSDWNFYFNFIYFFLSSWFNWTSGWKHSKLTLNGDIILYLKCSRFKSTWMKTDR